MMSINLHALANSVLRKKCRAVPRDVAYKSIGNVAHHLQADLANGRDPNCCDVMCANAYDTRQSIRVRYQLGMAPCADCCACVFCHCCVVSQNTRECAVRPRTLVCLHQSIAITPIHVAFTWLPCDVCRALPWLDIHPCT
jgi:Cys-rich protein (TIGR01571 family)